MKNFKAFTLAEVLITLGVIGVVSAMTMPVLIQNYKRHVTTTKLKKFYSMMSQAVQMSETEQGLKTWEWDIQGKTYSDDEKQQSYDDAYNYWNKYLAPYVKTVKIKKGVYDPEAETQQNLTTVYLSDGSVAIIAFGSCFDVRYDINGDKLPNEYGKDRFFFLIATSRTNNNHEMKKGQSFNVGWLPFLKTREKALNYCKNVSGMYCTTLLFYDNFEFKSDYPYKL